VRAVPKKDDPAYRNFALWVSILFLTRRHWTAVLPRQGHVHYHRCDGGTRTQYHSGARPRWNGTPPAKRDQIRPTRGPTQSRIRPRRGRETQAGRSVVARDRSQVASGWSDRTTGVQRVDNVTRCSHRREPPRRTTECMSEGPSLELETLIKSGNLREDAWSTWHIQKTTKYCGKGPPTNAS